MLYPIACYACYDTLYPLSRNIPSRCRDSAFFVSRFGVSGIGWLGMLGSEELFRPLQEMLLHIRLHSAVYPKGAL